MVLRGEIQDLKKIAKNIESREVKHNSCSSELSIVCKSQRKDPTIFLEESSENGMDYITLHYNGVQVTRDITYKNSILRYASILIAMFSIGILILTYLYSKLLSHDVRRPLNTLNRYLENISEKALNQIPKENLPEDLHLLADTINSLINRIDVFMGTQKELFIGASHELKTPLAVIKLKNQVLLMRKRTSEEYIEALKLTNLKVDEMNKVVSDVLNIGRQEGAQFESPIEKDVIKLLTVQGNDFTLLAKSQGKKLIVSLKPEKYIASIQKTLLHQIIQNFLQNALKFTPKGKKIELKSYINLDNYLTIEVIDEGVGIDETQDIFAPFNRTGDKSGVGLGLFLAKGGADSMGAKISVKNRNDGIDGTVASLELKNKLICIIGNS